MTGEGALLRGAGFPPTLPGLSTSSYRDNGAAQHPDYTPAEIAAAMWTYPNRTTT